MTINAASSVYRAIVTLVPIGSSWSWSPWPLALVSPKSSQKRDAIGLRRHCEERSDGSNPCFGKRKDGLLRFARTAMTARSTHEPPNHMIDYLR